MEPSKEGTRNDPQGTIVVTGGGTGGHLFPALAVVEAVQQKTTLPLQFIGLHQERDRSEVQRRGVSFYGIPLKGLKRRLTLNNFKSVFLALSGSVRCLGLLKRLGRGVIFGVGGYVSAPAMLAGKILGWKLTLHEQNAVPGLVNRKIARWCDRVFLTYKDSERYFKGISCHVTGMPIRSELIDLSKKKEPVATGEEPFILLVGGSQGAKKLVEFTLQACQRLKEKGLDFTALVQTGERNWEWAKTLKRPEQVELVPFIENMSEVYSKADVVISRAGSGSLSEIALWGLPSILIPYPFASEDHQRINAEEFRKTGAAYVINESELNQDRLAEILEEFIIQKEKRLAMGNKALSLANPNAASVIADELIHLLEVAGT